MFSGARADTTEHVVPKWLQRRFDLWNQTIVLPNGTTSPYRQVTVPVKSEHNSAFSAIETRISQGDFIPDEVYLWALKLHIGLIYRDSRLKRDLRDPSSNSLLDLNGFAPEILVFRQLYDLWRTGVRTKPYPFGTVLVLRLPAFTEKFDFFHCMLTGVIGIRTGAEFVLVFLWDQGDASSSNMVDIFKKYHLKNIENAKADDRAAMAYFSLHVWACETAYATWRRRRPINHVRTESGLLLGQPVKSGVRRSTDEATYRRICSSFGLHLAEFNGETHNKYSQLKLPERRGRS